jgi:hypothetical protein
LRGKGPQELPLGATMVVLAPAVDEPSVSVYLCEVAGNVHASPSETASD